MAVGTETMAGGRVFPRLHWGAVIAGVILAIAVHIVMGLIGGAIGLAAQPADSKALGVGAAIWALITPFVASLLGAWLACRMASAEDDRSAYLHGVLVWCLGLIAGAIFLTGTVASGAMTAGTAASGNAGAAQRIVRQETGRARVGGPEAQARGEDAAKGAAAGLGGAALAAIAGLLGSVVGAGLSRGRSSRAGRGLGWKIAIQRRDERHDGRFAETRTEQQHGYGTTPGMYGGTSTEVRRGGTSSTDVPPPDVGTTSDPYHH